VKRPYDIRSKEEARVNGPEGRGAPAALKAVTAERVQDGVHAAGHEQTRHAASGARPDDTGLANIRAQLLASASSPKEHEAVHRLDVSVVFPACSQLVASSLTQPHAASRRSTRSHRLRRFSTIS
jgi:hypothetical protein